MALSEYLHEMPRNRIICRKKVIKCAKKVFTQFYIIRRGCVRSSVKQILRIYLIEYQ